LVPDITPDQSPDAVHNVVTVDDQTRVRSFDSFSDEPDTLNVIVGTEVDSKMVTLTVSVAEPLTPVHASH
jgi:hypothetical protein